MNIAPGVIEAAMADVKNTATQQTLETVVLLQVFKVRNKVAFNETIKHPNKYYDGSLKVLEKHNAAAAAAAALVRKATAANKK